MIDNRTRPGGRSQTALTALDLPYRAGRLPLVTSDGAGFIEGRGHHRAPG